MSSGFWKAVCLMEVSSISRCVIILLKGTFNFWIFSAKVSLSLINCCPACSASLVLATTSPSAFTQPRTQSPTPVSPTTVLALDALADAFMACTSLILFLIANTSQPVSNSDSSSRFEVGPASRKFLEEGGVQVRTQLAHLFPDYLHRSKN